MIWMLDLWIIFLVFQFLSEIPNLLPNNNTAIIYIVVNIKGNAASMFFLHLHLI